MQKENEINVCRKEDPYVCIALRFVGLDFDPEEITGFVKIQPTYFKRFGREVSTSSGKTLTPKNSAWSYDKKIEWDNIDEGICLFIDEIGGVDFCNLPNGVEEVFVDILFVVESDSFGCASHEFIFSHKLLKQLSDIGIPLCVSFASEPNACFESSC